MIGFLIRMLITAFGLAVASAVVPGMRLDGMGTVIPAALLLGIVNAIIRPILVVLTLPITLVSLGFFLLIINAAMLSIVAKFLDGFVLTGFGAAFFGSIIVSVVSWVASSYIGPDGRFQVIVRRRDRE